MGADESYISCPKCVGRGTTLEFSPIAWHIEEKFTIGRVEVIATLSKGQEDTIFDNYKPQKKYEEIYMCEETGIGSGRTYRVENLFATREEAEKECQRRNKDKAAKEK